MHKEDFRVIKQKGFYKLINGDCLEVMKGIPDKSIDCIVCDPPYGTTACKWDSIIPFDLMWEQLERIIKDDGAIVLFGSEPFSSALRMSNIKNYKYDWKWIKDNCTGFQTVKTQPLKKQEDIIVFSLGTIASGSKRNMKYYPQNLTKIKPTIKKVGKKPRYVGARLKQEGKEYVCNFSNYPNNLLEFPREQNCVHPTQKPVDLLSYLIKTYSNEGETVLDFTMGSGSTGVACMETGRKFIGIELDEQYFKISCGRVKQALEYKNDYGDW